MFCYQCQEAKNNEGCKTNGMCGKTGDISDLQDVLVYALKSLSIWDEKARALQLDTAAVGGFICDALFVTITNANFDANAINARIATAFELRNSIQKQVLASDADAAAGLPEVATANVDGAEFGALIEQASVLATENEDVRSLRELLIYGLKGVAAYAHHAMVLGKEDDAVYAMMTEGLAATTKALTADQLVGLVMKTGESAVTTMALLDAANTGAYGNPEMTTVNLGVGNNPGILISGHDLKDMEELLAQTEGSGVDVYTHSEMLPAHYYPAFKKYDHFVGNYGGAWYQQKSDFDSFNGPILMTTNCIVPPAASYQDRIYTTGSAGFSGVKHIGDRSAGAAKDFSTLIAQAKSCAPPTEIETGEIVGGFAHAQVLALADKVVDAVKAGAVKKFVVMAGCDGRQKGREYFTEVARTLPDNTIILTAGCAKYRYNKLNLGDIGGIPRVLDAGQCNDSYSLAVIALKLKEVFALEDINDLPIEFDIAWYEQKAVAVLLALLHLGVKGIRLGPTLPAFLSPNVAKVLVDNFDIKPTADAAADVAAMTS